MDQNKKRSKKTLVSSIIVILIIASLIAGSYIFFHIRNVRSEQKTSGQVANVHSNTGEGNADKKVSPTPSSPVTTKSVGGSQTSDASTPPSTPTGNFVNNHRPGLNGTDTSMQSVCVTTPGATCDIVFANESGVKKNLGSKTVGSTGAVDWQWDIHGANLGPGSWTITAIATLNGKTATSTDAIKLEVQ